MKTQSTSFTPQSKDAVHMGHMHFFEYVDNFHGLEDLPNYDNQHKSLQEKLRHQYLHENNFEQNLCLRTCFKQKERKYVDFCLDRKCGGIDFFKAANILGYTRTGEVKSHAHAHH